LKTSEYKLLCAPKLRSDNPNLGKRNEEGVRKAHRWKDSKIKSDQT
jgi:hypothetical protein